MSRMVLYTRADYPQPLALAELSDRERAVWASWTNPTWLWTVTQISRWFHCSRWAARRTLERFCTLGLARRWSGGYR